MTRNELRLKLIDAGMSRYLAENLANEDHRGGAHIHFEDLARLNKRKVKALCEGAQVTDKGMWFKI
jgi:hypothetical protein